MSIRTLIVDDEALARERIRTLLSDDPEIEIVGECPDGEEAVKTIRARPPELLFLDVQMPEVDGFEVLRRIGSGTVPVVVFVTAYEQYAVQAFEFLALDYLLKPFDTPRFVRALERAKTQLADRDQRTMHRQLAELLKSLGEDRPSRLVIKESGRVSFLRVGEIDWIEAQGNYVKIHAGDQAPLLRRSLKELGARLDPRRFLRIHRSIVVNIDAIAELSPLPHGEFLVRLKGGTELTSNRTFREVLQRLL